MGIVKTTGACCPPAHRGGGNRGLAGRMTGQKRKAQWTSLGAQHLGSTEQGETKQTPRSVKERFQQTGVSTLKSLSP